MVGSDRALADNERTTWHCVLSFVPDLLLVSVQGKSISERTLNIEPTERMMC